VSSLPDIQKQLPPDAALILWLDQRGVLGAADPHGEHWACVIRRQGPTVWQKLPGSGPGKEWTREDAALPRRLRTGLTTPEGAGGTREELPRRLRAQRLTPLETHLQAAGALPAVTRLIVLPGGWMAGIPVETLTDRYTISYAPSGTVFARLQE